MTLEHRLSITELGAAIQQGLSPVRIVEACLDRIARHNDAINAMIFVDPEASLAAAHEAEAEIRTNGRRSALHGIPVALKDVIDVKGWPTSAASCLFDGKRADADAACVANLRTAGAIIIGKTNLHELTLGTHDNPWFGKVVNPKDSSRGTAGTSSGSAAAVAAGFCAVAVGSDTGGSNRSVAAANGLFGFKPSNGLIESAGTLPTAVSLDTIGPIATSIQDVRLIAEAMLGRALPGSSAQRNRRPDGITIAICPQLYNAPLDPVVERGIDNWLASCRRRGVSVVEKPFESHEAFVEAGLQILLYEFARSYERFIEANPERVGAAVRTALQQAQAISKATYDSAQEVRLESIARLPELLGGVDMLAVPTAPGLAPRLSDELTQVGATDVPYGLAGGVFRRWANMLGVPALAIPIPTTEAFPASVQLATPIGSDAALLDMAAALTSMLNDE